MRDAVDVAAAEQNLARRHADDLATRKCFAQHGKRRRILFAIEQRHHHATVGDVEVHVTRRQALAGAPTFRVHVFAHPGGLAGGAAQRPGHRQAVHAKALATRIALIHQTRIRIGGDPILRIARVIATGEQHHAGRRETREVVDVTVGLVAEHAVAEPHDLARAGIGEQQRFDAFATEPGIAIRIEQTLLRHEQSARTVAVDGPTLAHHGRAIASESFDLEYFARDLLVAIPGRIQTAVETTPGIEAPIYATYLAPTIEDAGRPDVAHPRIIARELDDADRRIEHRACAGVRRRRGADRHRFETSDRARDGREGALRRTRLVPPVVGALGPQHPATAVRLEFARHPETVRQRRGSQGHGHERHSSEALGAPAMRPRCASISALKIVPQGEPSIMSTPAKVTLTPPAGGAKISIQNGKLHVPDNPIIPFIEGDGTGADIWRSSVRVIDGAVAKAYGGKRKIHWLEVYAGEKSHKQFNTWLPDETVAACREYLVSIKGPLTTPIGGGIRSLNVALRQLLDLYVCLRPVRWFKGVPSPVKAPEKVDMVIFRENTEDIYAGIEFEQGTEENKKFLELFKANFPKAYAKIRFPNTSGIGIKPVSQEGTERLFKAAVEYAIANQRKSVTIVHKGNIQKFTEGAFRNWSYALAERDFPGQTYGWEQWERTKAAQGEKAANAEMDAAKKAGKVIIKDAIADITLQQVLTRPDEFDVLATCNLNGDYLSDALAAQVGGIGIAPGANINYVTGHAVFEATHGTAPKYANLDKVNPGSVILSGEMMLRYMGWTEAADAIIGAMDRTIGQKTVTYDFARLMEGATEVKCSEFGDALIRNL